MKAKMNDKLEVILKSENDLEKNILDLYKMIQRKYDRLIRDIDNMDVSERMLCKNILQYLVKLFKDRIPIVPILELDKNER